MPFNSRLLIGLNGHEPDVQLIRYASMVARLNPCRPRRGPSAAWSPCPSSDRQETHRLPASPPSPLLTAGEDPEIRFVYLFPKKKDAALTAWPKRAALRAQVQTYFTGLAEKVAVGCDVLKGHALNRLSAVAADFDSDLLLVGDAPWPRWKCGRLAMEAPCSVWFVPPDWAPVLRRVLVPIDFSPCSADCLRAAIDLTRQSPQAKCLALHVYRHETRFADEALEKTRRRDLAERFATFMAGIDTHGVAVEPIFADCHHIDREIARAAHRHAADLVVMASRGRSRAARIVLPSVTEKAIRQCRASFLVLKSTATPVGFLQALRERWRQADDLHFS